MNELHLFSGAGGGILGGILLGHTCVCAVEIDAYCRQVMLQRQRDGLLPKFPIWDDVQTFDGKPWRGIVDIVCGGFPCQDISTAGKGAGINGKRSGLWFDMARIVSEVQPGIVFVENSPLLIQRGLPVVLADLAKMGFDAKWGVVSAEAAGAPHKRERLWIVGFDPNKNYAARKGRPRHKSTKPRAEKGTFWNRGIGELVTECVTDRHTSYAESMRILHGLADRVDRLAAIGNGQVPAVAAIAWRELTK